MAEGGAPPAPIGGFPIASCRLKKLASQAWEGRARRTRPLSWGRLAFTRMPRLRIRSRAAAGAL